MEIIATMTESTTETVPVATFYVTKSIIPDLYN